MLGGVFFASYYTSHWAPVAGVNGQGISKDDVFARAKVNLARYDRQLADYTTLRNQGKITSDEFSKFQSAIENNKTGVVAAALTEIENELAVRQWAAKNGVSVTSQQVDDQVKVDATIPEMRHVMVIGVAPEPVPPAFSITAGRRGDGQDAGSGVPGRGKGRQEVDRRRDRVPRRERWADREPRAISGWSKKTRWASIRISGKPSSRLAKPNDLTALFKGSDGIYRFATVTEIVPKFVDSNWESSVGSASSGGSYRNQAEGEAIKTAVKKAIEAKYITSPTVQRRVLEISISPGYGTPGDGDEVQIRMMVFAPGHSTTNAPTHRRDGSDLDRRQEPRRRRGREAARRIPRKFDTMARDTTVNDDTVLEQQRRLDPMDPGRPLHGPDPERPDRVSAFRASRPPSSRAA